MNKLSSYFRFPHPSSQGDGENQTLDFLRSLLYKECIQYIQEQMYIQNRNKLPKPQFVGQPNFARV